MKIIVVAPNPEPSFEVIADSTLSLPARPVFLPDIPQVEQWKAQTLLAVRVCRLGKNVAEKFAARYFDAVTLAFRLLPFDLSANPISGITAITDSTLILGSWDADIPTAPVEVANGTESTTFSPTLIPKAIEQVSRYATLKMGDIILFPLNLPLLPAAIGTTLTATLSTRPLLTARLK